MSLKSKWCILACFLLFIKITSQNQPSYYNAGVVEYTVKKKTDPLETANANAENYVITMKSAADLKVDIIVFPEAGFTSKPGNHAQLLEAATYVPDPKDSVVPCASTNGYPEYFTKISCAARTHAIYVVINVHEKAKCLESPTCALELYNTNVVFDRSGTVVARYRKYNLFEPKQYRVSRTSEPELSIFTTDFGVTFGQLIGFDLLNQSPALTLIKEKNITDIIFSSRWASVLPFLTALQYPFGFSYANDINLLVSGSSDLSGTIRGSAIFAGTETLKQHWISPSEDVLLVARVPKVLKNGKRDPLVKINPKIHTLNDVESPTTSQISKSHFLYENLSAYTTEIYKADEITSYNKTLCNRGLCCTFNINSTFDSNEGNSAFLRHRLVVFEGVRNTTVKTMGLEVCGVISCLDETLESCGHVSAEGHPSPTNFTSIDISRSMEKGFEGSKLYVPSVLNSDTNLLDSTQFSFTIDKTRNNATLSLKTNLRDLMTFAIYGRDYAKDSDAEIDSVTTISPVTDLNNLTTISSVTDLNNVTTISSVTDFNNLTTISSVTDFNNVTTTSPVTESNNAATNFRTNEIFITILSIFSLREILY